MPLTRTPRRAAIRWRLSLATILIALFTIGAAAQKEIVVAQAENLATVDVHMQGNMSDMAALINMFDTLLTRDAQGDIQPHLATEWKAIHPTTWQFQLRDDVTFHDGEKLTAETVKYSIERVMDPEQQSPIQEFRTFESVEVVDQYTVNIHTSVVDPMVPAKLTLFGGAIVPKEYLEENGDQYFTENPVGSGPFQFVEWVKDDRLVLERYSDYWKGPAALDRVTFVGIPNAASRVSALMTGEVDIITQLTADFFQSIEGNSNTRIDSTEGLRIYYLSTASPEGPTADAKVRRAISHAIDTQLLIDELAGGQGVQIAAPVASANFGYNPELEPYEYNPERARELLAEAGYPDGFSIDFATRPGIYEDLAVAIAGMLDDVGIDANLQRLPPGQFEELYSRGGLPPLWNLGYTLWQGEPSVLIETFFLTGNPRTKFSSSELDDLIRALQSEVDTVKRRELIQEALAILHEQAPWTYLFQANEVFGVNERVEWTPPNNQILNMYNVDVAD
jgi:peptide/nickel transport system substrate-binding protein